MFITKSFESQIDDILNRIGKKLQLDDKRYKLAEERYKAVSAFLKNDENFFGKVNINMFPQGSYRIGTMIKPLKGEEYDLDFVLQMDIDHHNINPKSLLDYLYNYLNSNNLYRGKLEKKSRCVRINYVNEFHMDILPSCSYRYENDELLKIPDRELKTWLDSNPKGYSDWFEKQYIDKKIILEKAAKIEPIPSQRPYELLQPLQRNVQLMKRYRDIYFEDKPDFKPTSIILTTLSGLYYNHNDSEYFSIFSVLQNVSELIKNNTAPFVISNPSYTKENFSDKWNNDSELYDYFRKYINKFFADWASLQNAMGMSNATKILSELFGETITKTAINEQTEYINNIRKEGGLGIKTSTGIISSLGAGIMKSQAHTFYGD